MKQSFDVLTDGWIPVIDMNGNKKELGIKDVILQAHELKEISDSSPLVEYSIYRFSSVFLMDALQLEDFEDIDRLLENGRFDEQVLEDYLSMCEREGVSWNLFDADRPFMQTPFRAEWDKVRKPVGVLDYTLPTGNNHTHFDHRNYTEVAFSYGKAFRALLAAQQFCTAGAQGYPSGINGAPPYFTLIRGNNLFETLVYSMVAVSKVDHFDDIPVFWRNQHIIVEPKKEIVHTSYLYGMLFPARRILLIPNEKTQTVKEVYCSQGLNYTATNNWTDPHVTYRVNDKGRFPWQPDAKKAVWRNLNDLIGKNKCLIVKQYVEELDEHIVEKSSYIPLTIYGVQTNKASYVTEMRQDFDLPEAMFRNPSCEQHIKRDIEWAEQVAGALYTSLSHKEIPPQIAAQAQNQFYDACGEKLLELCKYDLAVEKPDFAECRRKWIEDVLTPCAWNVVNQAMKRCALRGKALMEVMSRQRIRTEEEQRKDKDKRKYLPEVLAIIRKVNESYG